MPERPDFKRMAENEARLKETDAALQSVLSDELRQLDDIRTAAGIVREEGAKAALRGIGLEELGKAKAGIRVSALRAAGFTDMAQIAELPAWRIRAIDGIGEKQADSIAAITRELVNHLAMDVPLSISPDDTGTANLTLVTSLIRYLRCAPLRKALEPLAGTCHTLAEGLPGEMSIRSGLKWVFSGRGAKEATARAVRVLETYLTGEDFAGILSLLADYQAAMATDARGAMAEFTANSAPSYALLDSLGVSALAPERIYSSVPAQLAAEISAFRFSEALLTVTLRSYQRFGVQYILHQRKVLLGDEMGLGKTIQAIGAMAALEAEEPGRHFLVVCPAGVLINWCREIAKHSRLTPWLIHGDMTARSLADWKEKGGVAVTNYETMAKVRPAVDNVMHLALLVIDEAHYIKNQDTQRSRNLRALKEEADRILMMSGTPLENKVAEMCSLLDLLDPVLADEARGHAFMSRIAAFREMLAPVYLRRTREDVLTELPPITEKEEWCALTEEDRVSYARAVLAGSFTTMRRVSFLQGDPETSSKIARLLALTEEAREDGRKVLVYSFFRDSIDMIMKALGTAAAGPITGSTPPAMRQTIIDAFAAGDIQGDAGHNVPHVLVCQIQAGGTGLNIQCASTVILAEPQIKPSLETQAIARVYRMGQARHVLVYRLLCENTIDEEMLLLLSEKQQIFDDYADESAVADSADDLLSSARIAELIEKERRKLLPDGSGESTASPEEG